MSQRITDGNIMEREEPTKQPYEALLDEQRMVIDAIDREIVELINRRSAVALEIGRIKMENSLPIYVSTREEQVLDRIEETNSEGIVPGEEMRNIFQAIMRGSRAVQKALHDGNWPQGHTERQENIE